MIEKKTKQRTTDADSAIGLGAPTHRAEQHSAGHPGSCRRNPWPDGSLAFRQHPSRIALSDHPARKLSWAADPASPSRSGLHTQAQRPASEPDAADGWVGPPLLVRSDTRKGDRG